MTTRLVPPLVLLALGLTQILQNRPMWYDEEYTQLASGVPIGTLLEGIWARQGVISYLMDVPPSFNGPFYLLMHAWVAVAGDTPFSLRTASLLGAAAATGVIAELVRRTAGDGVAWWTGLLAGLLVATNPLIVEETAQARSYGWALLALALTALWLQEWVTAGRRGPASLAAAGVAALLHWFTLPVLIGFAVYACGARRGGWRWAVGLVPATLPALALIGWSVAGGTAAAPNPIPVGIALPAISVFDWSGQQAWLTIGLVALAALGFRVRATRRLLICWLVIPLVVISAIELVRPSYFPRYLMFTLVGLAIAVAVAIGDLSAGRRATRWLRGAVAVATVIGCFVATVPVYDRGAREPSPDVVAYLDAHQVPGEPIIPADGRTSLDVMTSLDLAPRLRAFLVLPPELFTDQTTSRSVWLVRIVLKVGSLPVVPAEQRLIDAGWHEETTQLFTGASTDLEVERWVR